MAENEMRKYLNVLQEAGPMAPGAFDDPLNPMPAAPVPTAPVSDVDDVEAQGPVTKIEVTMKDGEEVEVEVHAQQGDELKRLMDLAGLFHKEKQTGGVGDDVNMAAPVPDQGMMPVEPVDGVDFDDMPPEGGPDVPVGSEVDVDVDADIDDIDNMGMDDAPEIDFALGDDDLDTNEVYETEKKKYDYGYPNPELGQEDHEINAYAFSGGARKPVRYVPARGGDNAMCDNSSRKSLESYMKEISEDKKKVISEVSPQDKVKDAINAMTAGVEVKPNTQKALDKIAKNRQTGLATDEPESEIADDVLDAAEQEQAVDPNTQRELEKNVMDMRKSGTMREQDFTLPLVDEDELEERKRRYSFSPAEFGRGIITSPKVRLKKAARRGMGRK